MPFTFSPNSPKQPLGMDHPRHTSDARVVRGWVATVIRTIVYSAYNHAHPAATRIRPHALRRTVRPSHPRRGRAPARRPAAWVVRLEAGEGASLLVSPTSRRGPEDTALPRARVGPTLGVDARGDGAPTANRARRGSTGRARGNARCGRRGP